MTAAVGLEPSWRADLDALAFRPASHRGICMVHRLAFRALTGAEAGRAQCDALFRTRRDAFERAALAKIERNALAPDENFHLTSRDLARALAARAPA